MGVVCKAVIEGRVRKKIFLLKIFLPKKFLLKIFLPKIFSSIISRQKYFSKKYFLEIFFKQNIVAKNIFTKNIFPMKKFTKKKKKNPFANYFSKKKVGAKPPCCPQGLVNNIFCRFLSSFFSYFFLLYFPAGTQQSMELCPAAQLLVPHTRSPAHSLSWSQSPLPSPQGASAVQHVQLFP